MQNLMDLLIEKMTTLEKDKENRHVELHCGEIRLILTALKIYDAIDKTLDERLGLFKQVIKPKG